MEKLASEMLKYGHYLHGWKDVEVTMPEPCKSVMVMDDQEDVYVAHLYEGHFYIELGVGVDVPPSHKSTFKVSNVLFWKEIGQLPIKQPTK